MQRPAAYHCHAHKASFFLHKPVGKNKVVTGGCSLQEELDSILAGVWLQLALLQSLKWWVRVSSCSGAAERPSWGLIPTCLHGWCMHEILRVTRWDSQALLWRRVGRVGLRAGSLSGVAGTCTRVKVSSGSNSARVSYLSSAKMLSLSQRLSGNGPMTVMR